MKQMVILLLFTLFVTNVFANKALDQMNSILTSRISAESVESAESAEEAGKTRGERNTANVREVKKANNLNIDSIKRMLGESYEFIFFYRSSCPYCRKFEPILKQYAVDVAIPVKAFTFDGIILPSFPDSVTVDKTVISKYFGFFNNNGTTIAVPALFIMNTADLHVFPVSSGGLSYMDLVMRMNELVPKILSVEGVEGRAHV